MPELNPLSASEMTTLKTELAGAAYTNLSDSQRVNALSAPSIIPNPMPQTQVPMPFKAVDVMATLSAASLGKFMALPVAPSVVDTLNLSDAIHAMQWAAAAAEIGTITPDEMTAISNLVQRTELDPSWRANVPGARPVERLFGAGKTWAVQVTNDAGAVIGTYAIDHPPLIAVQEAR